MADFAKLKAPEGVTAVSWMEKEYEVIKGFVKIEVEAVEHLVAHGFTGGDVQDNTDPTIPAGVASDLKAAE